MMWDGLNPPYATLVVDPPWHYDKVNPASPKFVDADGRVRSHGHERTGLGYSSLSLDEIAALPVSEVALEDARLFLWTTNRYLRHAWSIIEAWGFTPQDRLLVWCKKPRGTTPVTTEFVLMGKRGSPPRMPWHHTTWFDWSRTNGSTSRAGHQSSHSGKPAAFFDLVESWCPGPYVELFARAPRLGWDHWGYGYEQAS